MAQRLRAGSLFGTWKFMAESTIGISTLQPPKTYQLDIGYLAAEGKFYLPARSNVVNTPAAAVGDAFDQNWADVAKDFDRIFALSGGYSEPGGNGDLKEVFEERLQRPIGDPTTLQFGPGAGGRGRRGRFRFSGRHRIDRSRHDPSRRPRHAARRAGEDS